MSFLDSWKEWGTSKKILSVGACCCILVIIFAIVCGFCSDDANTSDSIDPFKGKNARLENLTITESLYGNFPINGKIMFKHDESYAVLSADVNLKDGSKISESIVENWNNVQKNQWYTLDGHLLSASIGHHSLSEIASIDFKYDDKVIYTFQNNS